jgi:hypothetical protein
MNVTEAVATDLRTKLSKAESKVKRLESTLQQARQERDELAVAMRVLVKHGYLDADHIVPANTNRNAEMNEMQNLVFLGVPHNRAEAVAPKDVTATLHASGHTDISGDYVRTTLWRLAQRDMLNNENGKYWRSEAPEPENVAASDARAPEADTIAGPLGGERGYPPSAPEGSIPSGSTFRPNVSNFADDMDDDIPF